jgi:hypothetical protein
VEPRPSDQTSNQNAVVRISHRTTSFLNVFVTMMKLLRYLLCLQDVSDESFMPVRLLLVRLQLYRHLPSLNRFFGNKKSVAAILLREL